jgi:SAM-dependent methyltransferase
MGNEQTYPPVLDVCCGSRAFWFDKTDARAMFVDKRAGVFPRTDKDSPRAPVVVAPDWQGSFEHLPFPPDTFALVVFDPPHIARDGKRFRSVKTVPTAVKYYGWLEGNWREELRRGFAECFRVLRPDGTLIFKWCESEIPVSDVLALTPAKPLIGHKVGKQAKTHWIAFLKPNAGTHVPERSGGNVQ